MYRIKYLLGIGSVIAAALYAGFGALSWTSTAVSDLDRLMPFLLCAVHSLVGILFLVSSYRSRKAELAHLRSVLRVLLRRQSSFTAEELATEANISLAEAHEYLLKATKNREILSVTRHEHLVMRAFPRHSMN